MGVSILHHLMRHRWVVALAVLAGATTLAGCSESNPSSDPRAVVLESVKQLQAIGADENVAALDDGDASEDDYYAAARRYQSCMRATGVDLGGPHLSPVDNIWLEWDYPKQLPDGAGIAEAMDSCTAAWSPVVSAYQATHKAVMDPSLRSAVAECMSQLAYETSGDEMNVSDFMGEERDSSSKKFTDLQNCIVTSSKQLFPDVPGVTISY